MVDQGLASSASLDTEQDSFACGQVSKLADGIFTFPSPLRTDVTASLQAELQHFQEECAQSGRSYARPSVLTTSGALLSDMGFQRLAEGLVKEVLSPMVATLFPQTQGLRSDEVLGVMLDYGDDDDPSSASPRRSADETAKESGMGAHFDNSCITLDICLGSEDFEGGDLVFSLPRQSQELAVRQTAGQAVLFSGSLEHWCRPVTRGRRVNLVLWCMSNTRVAAPGVFQRYSEYLALASTSAPALGSHNRECKTHVSFDVPTDYLKRGKHPTRECRPVSHSEGDSASQQEEQWTSSPTFGCNEATAEEVLEDLSDVLDSGSDVAAGHVLALCGVRLLLENFLAGSTKRRGPAARSVIALQRACRSCRDVFQPLAHKVSHHVGNPKLSKEIVTLQLGGCGAALGTAMWSLFSAEHGLNSRGEVACDHAESDELALGVFYGEIGEGGGTCALMSSGGTEDEGEGGAPVTAVAAAPAAAEDTPAAADKAEPPAEAAPSAEAAAPEDAKPQGAPDEAEATGAAATSTAPATTGAKAKGQRSGVGASLLKRSLEAIKTRGAKDAVSSKAPPAVKPASKPAQAAARSGGAPQLRPDIHGAIRRQLAMGPLAAKRGRNGAAPINSGTTHSAVKIQKTEVVAVKRLLGLAQGRPMGKSQLRAAVDLPPSKKPRLAAAPLMVKRQVDSDDEADAGKPKAPRPRIPVDRRSRNLMGSLLGHLESAHRDFVVKVEPRRWEPSPRPHRGQKKAAPVESGSDSASEEEEEEVEDVEDDDEEEDFDQEADLDRLQSALEAHYETMKSFISTSAEPTIFYLPAKHSAASRKKLAETRGSIDRKIESIPANIRSHLEEDDEDDDDEEDKSDSEEVPAPPKRKKATANGGVDPLQLFPQKAGKNPPRQNMAAMAAAAAAASVH
eukprot:CAMPEP_0178396480 /NCGR_PEP_ID=MMETSP0689_2-20121128/13749_1 /TAXON_ID=160604 /ORGANISM="Amphidinium massartii, Strain CS-259" /LENGTH=905 /DNA_ID=CAMNT_0020017153 /DNA_START=90 /DNA_END=2805 /DNA_ORIENTATION=+